MGAEEMGLVGNGMALWARGRGFKGDAAQRHDSAKQVMGVPCLCSENGLGVGPGRMQVACRSCYALVAHGSGMLGRAKGRAKCL